MRIIAIDYGLARTGVAVSDPMGLIATPLPNIPSKNFIKLLDGVEAVIKQYSPSLVIIGMPKRTDGKPSPMEEKVLSFTAALKERISVPTEFVNEMFTTVIASQMLHDNDKNTKTQRQLIDSAAAAVLLQGYIDGKRRNDQ